jgi:RHS repeat-associated protein
LKSNPSLQRRTVKFFDDFFFKAVGSYKLPLPPAAFSLGPTTGTKPKAYINWILLDEQFKIVSSSSGFEQVGNSGITTIHTKTNLTADKSGYLYIYTSNDATNVDVFFDNLQVTHVRGPLVSEDHYYPYGERMFNICYSALNFANPESQKRKYNGIEKENDLGLEVYDAQLRELDGQIGRWWQIDPKTENMEMWSPYASNYDNPITYMDPLGDEPDGCCKGILNAVGDFLSDYYHEGVLPGLHWINKNVNPLYGAVNGTQSIFTGKSLYGEPMSKGQGVTETLLAVIPGAKIEGAIVKASEKVIATSGVKAAEKQVLAAEVKAANIAEKKLAPTIKEQAEKLIPANGGKNSVTIKTPTQQIRYDLAGKAHGGIPTPHKQIYNKNSVDGILKSITRASKVAEPITQEEIRLIKNYLKKL